MAEVSLLIDGQVFKAKKEVLCEHSDYFRAMFSGNYVENDKKEISIDVIDAESMKIILHYMNIGLIDLTEYSLSIISELVTAANFLQITELIKQIEYTLELQISPASCMEIMNIAQNSAFTQIEQLSATCGLLSFKSMKPEYIPNLTKLCWYLSHPYLNASSELDVFNFGHTWLLENETGGDALLIILGCLDIKKLNLSDIAQIKTCMLGYQNSLAAKVVDCLHNLAVLDMELSVVAIQSQEKMLTHTYTEGVYNETLSMVKESRSRSLAYTPAVPVWAMKDSKLEMVPHHMYTFREKVGFENWLEVAEKNLWGWSVVGWGPTKIVVVCGEHGRGTGLFMKDVKVYDVLKKEWARHGVELPARRHGGVAVMEDSLYLIGGVGGFRVTLDTAVVYDLKRRSHRKIANLPDAIQNPAVCAHEGTIYAAGHNNIYQYEDLGDTDRWTTVVGTQIRSSCMASFKGYIYCTQSYFSQLYRFRPGVDDRLYVVTQFTNPPATFCNLGNRLLFFTRSMCGQADVLNVEEYLGNSTEEKPKVIWRQSESAIKLNDVAGSCSLVLSVPPLWPDSSNYTKKYLKRYETQ
ncbi:kelch-like protein 8 isoform X2 [Cydia amplana]|uniref:kelch-like protein 8 isoform X2 n=1 Tax=Cydia amplana TaxID=1869771 RepID=UPI002FE5B8D7